MDITTYLTLMGQYPGNVGSVGFAPEVDWNEPGVGWFGSSGSVGGGSVGAHLMLDNPAILANYMQDESVGATTIPYYGGQPAGGGDLGLSQSSMPVSTGPQSAGPGAQHMVDPRLLIEPVPSPSAAPPTTTETLIVGVPAKTVLIGAAIALGLVWLISMDKPQRGGSGFSGG